MDKWVDDKDLLNTASTSSPALSIDTPPNHNAHANSQVNHGGGMGSTHDAITCHLADAASEQQLHHRMSGCHGGGTTSLDAPSPAPPHLTPDAPITFNPSDVQLNAPCLVSESEHPSLSSGFLLSSADSAALQSLGQVLMGGQNAMLLSQNPCLEKPLQQQQQQQTLADTALSSCMVSNIKSTLDSLSDPPTLSPHTHIPSVSLDSLHAAGAIQLNHLGGSAPNVACSASHVLPSASTLIGHDRIGLDSIAHATTSTVFSSQNNPIVLRPKQEDLGSTILTSANTLN